jgi:GNAT superfamily N-acetyltransferase
MNDEISIRPMCSPEDDDFDLSVYASTRLAELAVLGWTPEQVDHFVSMQYQAQTRHYRQQYPGAAFSIITAAGESAGRLIVARSEQDILIVDIALLPLYRAAGIGGILVRRLLAEADEAGIPLRCHVEQSNPARGFWQHLGLLTTRVDGAHVLMERKCATSRR